MTIANISNGESLLDVRTKLNVVIDKVNDIPLVSEFASLAAAISAAMSGGFVVGVAADTTIRVPTDAPTLQDAFDHVTPLNSQCQIDVLIESGHQPASGVSVADGDFGQWSISSVDAEVTLSASFAATDIIKGSNARMPRLNCLIDANGEGVNGYFADAASTGFVSSGCGIKNAAQQACYANGASSIYANDTIWTGASQASPAYSGILSWNSVIYASGADVSNSLYYGAQAAAAGLLHFRNGVATGAARHGIRATNAGIVNARSATSNNCSVSGFRSFDTGVIHATGATATGNATAFWIENGSKITADSCTASATNVLIYCVDNSNFISDTMSSTDGTITCSNGSKVALLSPTISDAAATRLVTISNGSEVFINGGSLSGGTSEFAQADIGSKLICNSASLTAPTGATNLVVARGGSEVTLIDCTVSYPNDAINCDEGSLLRVNGSSIPAADIPGMLNATLYARGILWGAT